MTAAISRRTARATVAAVAAFLLAIGADAQPADAGAARAPGSWTQKASLPVNLQDAGGAAVGGRLYVVGGKTPVGHQSALYVYNPRTNSWRNLARALPGPAVENPAVAAYAGRLYVFGGSTSAFSGAVRNAAVFNPATRRWRSLRPMPAALGGATAKAIGRRIYVAGGMTGGASVASLYAYNPRTNRWTRLRNMSTRRDNPGSAVLRDRTGKPKLYVFGGRIRNANGDEVNGTLRSVEMYNPVTRRWVARAPMPTGRRAMVVGTLGGRAQVMGGEKKGTSDVFSENEEYMPRLNRWRALTPMRTPRHGAVAGTINGVVYVAGGGVNAGSSFTDVNDAFSL